MSDKAFIDTNLIVYLFDSRFPAKQERAGELFQQLAAKQTPIVSTQVIQEAFVALTRKLGMDPDEALASLQMMNDAAFIVQPVDLPLVWRAAVRSKDDGISFWDALIVEAALEAQCSVLFTEDRQLGRQVSALAVVNPFT